MLSDLFVQAESRNEVLYLKNAGRFPLIWMSFLFLALKVGSRLVGLYSRPVLILCVYTCKEKKRRRAALETAVVLCCFGCGKIVTSASFKESLSNAQVPEIRKKKCDCSEPETTLTIRCN